VTAKVIQDFGQCIYERDKLGQLQRINYGSEWKQIWREPRRGPIDRRLNLEKGRLNESACVPLRDERREQRRKNATDRRDPRRLTCGGCLKDFPDVPSMVEHLPCKANHELVRLGFWDFITGIKKNGGPSNGETEKLRNVVGASLSEDAYRLACDDRLFVPQRSVSEAENFRAYRLEWLAALLSLIRPTQIDPDLLTRIERQELSRIAETLCRLPEGPQKKNR